MNLTTYMDKDGKTKKVNYLTKEQQERMEKNGWYIQVATNWDEQVDAQALYNRLIEYGYKEIKIYYDTTRIRGLHHNYAFVKMR